VKSHLATITPASQPPRQVSFPVAYSASTPGSGSAVSSDLKVAVLPFTFRGSGEAEALADGLTEDITAGLSRFPHLRIVARHAICSW
jgi:TolB-like protein